MAAPPPPSKRFHPSLSPLHSPSESISDKDPHNIAFPWNDAVPDNIREWFEALAKAHNTAPEYVFVGALVTTAVLMGPRCYVKVGEFYREPTNLFAVCIGWPGSGKSQAYNMTVRDPLKELPSPLSSILVDDYTKKGLFLHLQKHEGRALLAHDELGAFFDLVQKRQLEGNGERQLYCRLYDGSQWVSSTGVKKSEGRQEVGQTCVCISGYVQPQPFKERIYPQLTESDDGFIDRLLICTPKTRMLMEEEIEEWSKKLHSLSLTTLEKLLRLIAEWHSNKKDRDYVYEYDENGKQVYRSFANEMAVIMNEMWDAGVVHQGNNVSKDKRIMIRLCGHIHVLYKAVNMCLRSSNITPAEEIDPTHVSATGSGCEETDSIPEFPEEEEIPELPPPVGGESSGTQKPSMDGPSMLITEEEARMAVALTEYFQEQRKAYEQVCVKRRQGSHNVQSEESRGQTLEAHILLSKGAFCTPRSIIRTITTRKKPSTAEVTDAMKSLADSGIGEFKALSEKEKVFFKPLPSEKAHVGHVDAQLYQERFEVPIDEKYITNAQYNRLLNNSPNKDVLESQFQYNKR